MSFVAPVVARNPDLSWKESVRMLRFAGGHKSVLLGFGPEPVFVHEEALQGHMYVVGPPGTGKTSRVLAPLLCQRIEQGQTVFCIDCKPDLLLLGHLREAARAAGRTFHLFSLQPYIASHFSLDFFKALASREARHIAEFLVASAGLNKSVQPYFTSQNAGALAEAVRLARSQGRASFRSIAHALRGIVAGNSKRYEHAVQALDVFEGLAAVPELNPATSSTPCLDLQALIQSGGVAYFCLPVSTEMKLTSVVVGGLLLKLTSMVSKDLTLQGRAPRPVTFAIDEFQDISDASDLKELVAQVRGIGGGITLMLSHQVPEQIQDEGLQALLLNAGLLVLLAPRQFARQLQEWSGEKSVMLRSSSKGQGISYSPQGLSYQESYQENMSESLSETIRPALDLNTIQDVNATPGGGFVVIQRQRPRPLFFPHHVSRREAKRREALAVERASVSEAPENPPATVDASAPLAIPLRVTMGTLGADTQDLPFERRATALAARLLKTTLVSKSKVT